MSITFITKCLFIFFSLTCEKNLVEFAESTDPNPVTEKEQTQSTATELDPSNYPQDIKLFKADPNDANGTVELDTSEYKVKKDGDDHIYEFNDGVNCSLIKHKDKDVWKYGTTKSGSSTDGSTTPDPSEANAKYPKSMTVMKETIFIYFEGRVEVYSKVDDGWYLNKTSTYLLNQILSASKPADGSAQGGGSPPADGGSGTHTSSGEGTGKCKEGGEDGSSQTSGGDGGSKAGEEDTGTGGGDGSQVTTFQPGGSGTEPGGTLDNDNEDTEENEVDNEEVNEGADKNEAVSDQDEIEGDEDEGTMGTGRGMATHMSSVPSAKGGILTSRDSITSLGHGSISDDSHNMPYGGGGRMKGGEDMTGGYGKSFGSDPNGRGGFERGSSRKLEKEKSRQRSGFTSGKSSDKSKQGSASRGPVSSHKGTGGSHDSDDENEEAGSYDKDENSTAQPAGGAYAGSLRRGSTQISGSDSHVVTGDASTDSDLASGLPSSGGSTPSGSSETCSGTSRLLSGVSFGKSSSKSNKEKSKEESGSTSSGWSGTWNKVKGFTSQLRSGGLSRIGSITGIFTNFSAGSASADAGSSSTDGSVSVPGGGAADGSGVAVPANESGFTTNENLTAQTSGGDDGQCGEKVEEGKDSTGTYGSDESQAITPESGCNNTETGGESGGSVSAPGVTDNSGDKENEDRNEVDSDSEEEEAGSDEDNEEIPDEKEGVNEEEEDSSSEEENDES